MVKLASLPIANAAENFVVSELNADVGVIKAKNASIIIQFCANTLSSEDYVQTLSANLLILSALRGMRKTVSTPTAVMTKTLTLVQKREGTVKQSMAVITVIMIRTAKMNTMPHLIPVEQEQGLKEGLVFQVLGVPPKLLPLFMLILLPVMSEQNNVLYSVHIY